MYHIRQVRIEDAQQLIELVNTIAGESENLTFTSGEFTLSLEQERSYLQQIIDHDGIYLVAEAEGQIIGLATCQESSRSRTAHRGELSICIRRSWWHRGVGSTLMERLLEQASQKGLRKIDLEVREDNVHALRLYEKFGFLREGIHRRMFCDGDRFVDGLYMGRFLD